MEYYNFDIRKTDKREVKNMKMFIDCDKFKTTLLFDDGTVRYIKGRVKTRGDAIINLSVQEIKNIDTNESFKHQFMDIYLDCAGCGMVLYDYLIYHDIKVNKIELDNTPIPDNIVIDECSDEFYNYYLKELGYASYGRHYHNIIFPKEKIRKPLPPSIKIVNNGREINHE